MSLELKRSESLTKSAVKSCMFYSCLAVFTPLHIQNADFKQKVGEMFNARIQGNSVWNCRSATCAFPEEIDR